MASTSIKLKSSKRRLASKQRFHIEEFTNPSREVVFRVSGYRPDGTRVRENFKTREEAIGRKAELDVESANFATSTLTRMKATRLSDQEVKDAESAFARLGGRSLLEAVDFYLNNHKAVSHPIDVAEAFERFIGDRRKQNRRPDTLRNLQGRVGMFCRFVGSKRMDEISSEHCRDFVFRHGTSPRNQINDKLAVSNFFNWCVRREYASINPLTQIEKPAVDPIEPAVLSLDECRALLTAALDYKKGLLLPYVALSLFAGLRPKEIARLTWSRIDLDQRIITLDGSIAKTRQRRIVELPDNAVRWLLPFSKRSPKLVPPAFARHFSRVKSAAGFTSSRAGGAKSGQKVWIQDCMRHTAISMHLALHKHEGEAATWAGNSPNVIHRHYKGLVKESDAQEYWSLSSDSIGSKPLELRTESQS